MKMRALLVLLALPLVAFDCGGKDEPKVTCPYACRLQVRGAVTEDLCCVAFAYDYSSYPVQEGYPPLTEWVFMLTGFRPNVAEEPAAVSVFLDARPALSTAYSWDADGLSTTAILWGHAERVVVSYQPPSVDWTNTADSTDGTGALSLTFTAIPPSTATGDQTLAVHGALTATLPVDPYALVDTGGPVTFSATF